MSEATTAYKCKVLLKGNLLNQVPKILTAPETLVMRWLHGGDAIIDLAEYGDYGKDVLKVQNWSNNDERERLKTLYDPYLKAERGGRNPTSIDQMFGMFNALPEKLNEVEHAEDVDDDEDLAREEIAASARRQAEKATNRINKPRPKQDAKTVSPVELVDA